MNFNLPMEVRKKQEKNVIVSTLARRLKKLQGIHARNLIYRAFLMNSFCRQLKSYWLIEVLEIR